MSRFNFFEITLQSQADVTKIMDNFNKIESNGLILEDLDQVVDITVSVDKWVQVNGGFEYQIENENIKEEPYQIQVIFTDLSLIQYPINPKANSQAAGSIRLITTDKPTQDLLAKLIISKGRV